MFTKQPETNYTAMFLALLSGAAAGLAVGLLMAPKPGTKLRAEIGNTVDDYVESARQKAADLRTSASNLAQRGLKEVTRTKAAVSDAIDTGAKKGHEAVDYAADAVRSGTVG